MVGLLEAAERYTGGPVPFRAFAIQRVRGAAIDAARAEAGGQPSPFPDGADARTFFVHGLYDEIVQQPSNLFETRVFPDGSERYIPVSQAVWTAGLDRVKAVILRAN
jgi:hypothetical protein